MFKKNDIKNQYKAKRKGQSTVEYIILVAAILAALLIFLRPGGIFTQAVNRTFVSGTNGMEDMANRLANSR